MESNLPKVWLVYGLKLYVVDIKLETCTCPYWIFNLSGSQGERRCKHIRMAREAALEWALHKSCVN
jgi:predicted nucleic acid-binding Zn finger protein